MPSFFEKLKKGMGIEEPTEEPIEETEEAAEEPVEKKIIKHRAPHAAGRRWEKPLLEQAKKMEAKRPQAKKIKIETVPLEEGIEEKVEEKKVEEEKTEEKKVEEEKEGKKWFKPEGQLAIDVYQTENELVIQSAIAGVKPEDLDISIEKDIIAIKGSREKPLEENGDYFFQECYWGPFSREVILPVEVDPNRTTAEMKEGILIIKIPKISRERKRKIVITS